MSAMRTFTVRGTTQIAIELVRAVAKVDFSYTVAADFSRSLSVRSVRLCNVPRFAALFGEGRITADGECAATEAFPADDDGYSAVYYLPENLQGENVSRARRTACTSSTASTWGRTTPRTSTSPATGSTASRRGFWDAIPWTGGFRPPRYP